MNIEIFCCSGGMAKGFRDAGIEFDFALDANPDACDSYERNLGHRPVQMDVRDLVRLARAGWRPGDGLRLLVADPPCTPWSRAGKRLGTDDNRDMLADTCELISLLRPAAYLIGNIPGLDDSTNLATVQQHIGGLSRSGYCTADYARLDAADYGVPQHRVRPFWFGHREGPCIRWPAPTHGDPAEVLGPHLPGYEPLKPWVTCRQALQHLPLEELGRPIRLRLNYGNGKYWSELDQPALVVLAHETCRGGHWLAADPNRPPDDADAPARTVTASGGRSGQTKVRPWRDAHPTSKADRPANTLTCEGGRAAVLELQPNAKHPPAEPDAPAPTISARSRGAQGAGCLAFRPHHAIPSADESARTQTTKQDDGRFLAWPWDRHATTVKTDPRLEKPGHHAADRKARCGLDAVILSERAAAIIQGFPDPGAPGGWFFAGKTKKARWSMLGQAMPSALAQAVAGSIRRQMEATK